MSSGASESVLEVRPTTDDPSPRVKPTPTEPGIPIPFSYAPSDDGTDENLLILLHGLGDTHTPFAKLGRQFRLPQTATLALRAPDQIPYLYEPAYQWYESFDPLGELLANPNPTPALELLDRILTFLISACKWRPERIHLFGFVQGGSLAGESALKWWREHKSSGEGAVLGSVVSIGGHLLSHPTLTERCPTPYLVFHRPSPAKCAMPTNAVSSLRKGFTSVTELQMVGSKGPMPASKGEWEGVMRFWSEHLARRRVEGLYEVMSGMAPAAAS